MSGASPGPAADPDAPYARLAVAGLIRRPGNGKSDDRWLLLRREAPGESWDPPGGRLERGEDLTGAVKREMYEETGLRVTVAGPCYAYLTYHKGERLLAVSMACAVADDQDADLVRVEAEVAGFGWKTAGEWQDLARAGRSTWTCAEVRKVTCLTSVLWEAESCD